MPLNWEIGKCKDWETLKSDQEWPVTNALIWASMSVGIREITEENLPEYYARIHTWESLKGAFLRHRNPVTKQTEDRPITIDDLRKRIGLWTNASTMNRTEWLKNFTSYVKREMDDYKGYAQNKLTQSEPVAA
jgi:hypothetical protein